MGNTYNVANENVVEIDTKEKISLDAKKKLKLNCKFIFITDYILKNESQNFSKAVH